MPKRGSQSGSRARHCPCRIRLILTRSVSPVAKITDHADLSDMLNWRRRLFLQPMHAHVQPKTSACTGKMYGNCSRILQIDPLSEVCKNAYGLIRDRRFNNGRVESWNPCMGNHQNFLKNRHTRSGFFCTSGLLQSC